MEPDKINHDAQSTHLPGQIIGPSTSGPDLITVATPSVTQEQSSRPPTTADATVAAETNTTPLEMNKPIVLSEEDSALTTTNQELESNPETPVPPATSESKPQEVTQPQSDTLLSTEPVSQLPQDSPASPKKSKLPIIAIAVAVVVLTIGGILISIHKPAKKVVTKPTITKPATPNFADASIPATTQQVATAFITAVQVGDKTTADNLQSPELKNILKKATGYDSYFDYCRSSLAAQTCAALKWVNLGTAVVAQTDSKLDNGTAVKSVTFAIKSVIGKATSINTLDLELSPNGKSWFIQDAQQSFSGTSS